MEYQKEKVIQAKLTQTCPSEERLRCNLGLWRVHVSPVAVELIIF